MKRASGQTASAVPYNGTIHTELNQNVALRLLRRSRFACCSRLGIPLGHRWLTRTHQHARTRSHVPQRRASFRRWLVFVPFEKNQFFTPHKSVRFRLHLFFSGPFDSSLIAVRATKHMRFTFVWVHAFAPMYADVRKYVRPTHFRNRRSLTAQPLASAMRLRCYIHRATRNGVVKSTRGFEPLGRSFVLCAILADHFIFLRFAWTLQCAAYATSSLSSLSIVSHCFAASQDDCRARYVCVCECDWAAAINNVLSVRNFFSSFGYKFLFRSVLLLLFIASVCAWVISSLVWFFFFSVRFVVEFERVRHSRILGYWYC